MARLDRLASKKCTWGFKMNQKIRLMPLDCHIPNLALLKLSAWHKFQGDYVDLDEDTPDIMYVSSPFSQADKIDRSSYFPGTEIKYGGYGFNKTQLPYEIEHIMPDYSIVKDMAKYCDNRDAIKKYFKNDFSLGYTTRGCIRNCKKPPCIVPEMEGHMRRNSPIEEFHNPVHKKIMLLDNNILADREWFFKNADYLIENNLKLTETQGFDIRLIDEEVANYISKIKFVKQIHFALDSLSYAEKALDALNSLDDAGIKRYRLMFYIYEKDDLQDLIARFNLVTEWGCDPFVMPDIDATADIKRFARFVNRRVYKSCEWKDYR
jgi:hypothetical protein